MSDLPPTTDASNPPPRIPRWPLLLLAALLVLAHGWTLNEGLTLDDHWHAYMLRTTGWSPTELLNVTTIDPENFIDCWWQTKPVVFKYARPASVLLMKIVYTVSGGSPYAQHVVSLALHWLTCTLVYLLAWRVTRQVGWSALAGCLMAAYPLAVFAVGWLAAQNVILQTALCVAALLAWMNAFGLADTAASLSPRAVTTSPLRSRGWLAAALGLWVVALLSRENAIVMPAVFVAVDVAFSGWRTIRRRLGIYAVLAAIGGIYLFWRLHLVFTPLPDVYLRRAEGWDYIPYLIAKLLHYCACAVWPAPMMVGPSGRLHPFRDTPEEVILTALILLVLGGWYAYAARRVRGAWVWPTWIVLAVLPVTAVLATPHTGYMCGVGFALCVVVGPAARAREGKAFRWLRRSATAGILAVGLGFTLGFSLMWKGMILAENFVLADLRADASPAKETRVFFINLPFAAIYSPAAITEDWSRPPSAENYHVLTFAPQLERMDQRFIIEQKDLHTFRLWTEHSHYFSGLLGRFLMEAMRDSVLQEGQTIAGNGFTATIDEVTADGVEAITFRFDRPLTDPSYRFYACSWERGALRLDFSQTNAPMEPCPPLTAEPLPVSAIDQACRKLWDGDENAINSLFATLLRGEDDARKAAEKRFIPLLRIVAEATGAPIVLDFDGTELPVKLDAYRRWWGRRLSPEELETGALPNAYGKLAWSTAEVEKLRCWWKARVSAETMRRVFSERKALIINRADRGETTRGRGWVRELLSTDLYLTGDAFPGPEFSTDAESR